MIRFEAEEVPAELLPKPVGWRLLISPVKIEEMTRGGIALVADSVKSQEYFRNVAKVLAVGEGCYQHPKFNGGIPLEKNTPRPWCKVGDVIQYSSYTGAEIIIKHAGKEHKVRVINDDEVITVITDLSILNIT